MGRMKDEAIRQAIGSYESVLFRWIEDARGRALMPFALRSHGSEADARASVAEAVPANAAGAIVARLEGAEGPFDPPRQIVLHRVGDVPRHV